MIAYQILKFPGGFEGVPIAHVKQVKHKLMWEALDGRLKNKLEIQWYDIVAIKATYPDDGHGTLDVVLSKQPLFLSDTNHQPIKHTLWQATSYLWRHYLQCPQGLLGTHFKKLIQCDAHLNFLNQQAEVELESSYSEPMTSVFDEPNKTIEYDLSREALSGLFDLHITSSPSSSSRSELHEPADLIVQHFNPRRADKKGQTTLHMAVKGLNVVVVSAFIKVDNALINMVDKWDKHRTTHDHKKGSHGGMQIMIGHLLSQKEVIKKEATNKHGETPLYTALKFGKSEITCYVQQLGCELLSLDFAGVFSLQAKGGRLKLEKANEHYLLKLQREWQEEYELASKASESVITDATKSQNSLEKPKKLWPAHKTQTNLFYPNPGKVKSLVQDGIGKHKYSFQRLQVPSTTTHFCDCESTPLNDIKKSTDEDLTRTTRGKSFTLFKEMILEMDIPQKDKNEAKRTKSSTGMERVQEIKAEGKFILSLNQIQSH
ncbi:hypothetical protein Tco_0715022 [Tanacetum coccineum]